MRKLALSHTAYAHFYLVEQSLNGCRVTGWIHATDEASGRAACNSLKYTFGVASIGGTSLDGFQTIAFEFDMPLEAVHGRYRMESREAGVARVEGIINKAIEGMSGVLAEDLDKLTAAHTAFATFQALLDAQGGYFPSIRCDSAPACTLASGGKVTAKQHREQLTILANNYDMAQAYRNDARRVFRS